MSTCTFLVGDVFARLAAMPDASVDMVMTSPPFIGLREYLPMDHPGKGHEIGLEPTPSEFIATMLRLMGELRRVLAPHGSVVIELGDTYSGSGGAGGDYYNEDGWRADQPKPRGSARLTPKMRQGEERFDRPGSGQLRTKADVPTPIPQGNGGPGWPMPKSKALMPELLRVALVYGLHPLTGEPSPAGMWINRNVVTWARSNPTVGALGDKFRPATSDIMVFCLEPDRYWDEVSIRVPASPKTNPRLAKGIERAEGRGKTADERRGGNWSTLDMTEGLSFTRPPYDWWVINASGGYTGAHFAVYPPEVCSTPIMAMCAREVCESCGEPRRPIVESRYTRNRDGGTSGTRRDRRSPDGHRDGMAGTPPMSADKWIAGWTHCACHAAEGCVQSEFEWRIVAMVDDDTGEPVVSATTGKARNRRERFVTVEGECHHQHHRRGVVLDPFGGSGTTGMVATGQNLDAILIDLDERNVDLARDRVGPLFFAEG